MKKSVTISLLLCIIVSVKAQVVIDWNKFLQRNDMVWDALPSNWDNAPFVGNGCLGTIFWLNNKGNLQFEVSRSDLYDHRQKDGVSGLYARCRLPNGHFELSFGDTKPVGSMRLDLWNAEARGELIINGKSSKIRCFTLAHKNVIVLQIIGNEKHQLIWKPDSAKSTRSNAPKNLIAYPAQVLKSVNDCNVSIQEMPDDDRFFTAGLGTGQYATAWKSVNTDKNTTTYFISVGFSYPGRTAVDEAVNLVEKSSKEGIEAVTKSHRAWWHNYYPKSFLSVPDAAMESFYWAQMYKMASASRQGGPVLDLMGPWFMAGNWPAIWWNLNIQLTYWPYYMSNHLDEAEPMAVVIWKQRQALAQNAAPYSDDSYAIGRASAQGLVSPVGGEVGNLPWAMHNLWMYYRSSMDDNYLKNKLFPLMKGSFNYLNHIVVKQPNGTLTLPNTASPEYTDAVENCTYTLSCLRWLATTLIEADTRLKSNDPIVAKCKNMLANLTPYPTDSTGLMVGKDLPFKNSHRHWSHLFMIYPFHEYTWDNPDQAVLIEKSLNNWLSKPQYFRGYSWIGGASILSDGGKGDEALTNMKTFLKTAPLPNTLYRENWPVVETPLAFARSLQEMLMTCYGGTIRIFPGLPSTWLNACFADFRAEGAFLVTAQRANGSTSFIQIKSLAGEPCRVSTGMTKQISILGKFRSFKDLGKGIVEIGIGKGETVVIYSGTKPKSIEVSPVIHEGSPKAWGGKNPTL